MTMMRVAPSDVKRAYDAAGNAESYGALNFTYNNRGRLESTTGDMTAYLYNALGQIIAKAGALGTTIFMQDETGHLIGEYDGSGNLIEETVWLDDTPVVTLQPNGSGGVNVYYVHSDHLNAPRKVAQPSTGTLAWRWDTDPFGTAAPNENPAGLGTFTYNLRFPGQYYQAETGLNQNWNRDYDPLAARFAQSDPVAFGEGASSYWFADASPVAKFDSDGMQAREEIEPWPTIAEMPSWAWPLQPVRPSVFVPMYTYTTDTEGTCGMCFDVYFVARVTASPARLTLDRQTDNSTTT